MKVVDGKNAVLGRLASLTARELLKGEDVAIVNAEKVIITGDPKQITGKYLKRRRLGSPQHGPFFPTHPDAIVRRTVRGMLPYKTPKGRAAFKKLRVYVGVPHSLAGRDAMSVANKLISSDFTTVRDVSRILGWHERK
jgi:large subunit ribosomal protein L13